MSTSLKYTRFSRPLFQIVLFFVLALAVSLPTAALAAPVRQPTDTAEAEAVAYYESEEISTDGTDAVFIGITSYDDNTFEFVINSPDFDVEPTVAYGEYEETADGVLLTLIGVDGEDADETAEVELLFDADDSLVIPGEPDGMFGTEDIILYPADVPVAEETGTDEVLTEVGGAYISPVQASDGAVYLLNLLPDGSASLSTDLLDMTPALFEMGTWASDEEVVTLELAGTLEEDYEEALVYELTVGEFGELMIDTVILYPLALLDYLSEDFSDDPSEDISGELGEDESDVFIFVAEVLFPDDEEVTVLYLWLYDNGTVILSDEAQTVSLYGEWTFNEDETLDIAFTSDDETELDEPLEFVFEFDEESALVATDYPVDIFGEDGLIFYSADQGDEAGNVDAEFFIYQSEPLPSEDDDEIVISLVLSEDGAAVMGTGYVDEEEPYLEYGEWTRDDEGTVIVTLTEGPDGEYDEPYIYTFVEDEDDLSLLLVEESVEYFGEVELVLERVE